MRLFVFYYFCIVSGLAFAASAYDKRAAKYGWRRVSERALLMLAAAGGSLAMFFTMRLIRHKTKKMKFMLGIPLLIALQLLCLTFFKLRGYSLF